MIPIVILASGRGSNFDAIHQSIVNGQLKAEIRAVISDQSQALVLEKARKLNIPAIVVPIAKTSPEMAKTSSAEYLHARRLAHEERLMNRLQEFEPQFLVLAGYMRVLTPTFIDHFRSSVGYSKIINIHPSLLPSFPGIHSYQQAFNYGTKITGVTVHLVEAKVDCGPICAQEAFSIENCRTAAEVEEIGLRVEHSLFPKTLSWVLAEKFEMQTTVENVHCVRRHDVS